MKLILIVTAILMLATSSPAAWFGNKEQEQKIAQQEQQLAAERNATGTWQLIAGVTAIGAVILFTVGTALGSTTRRYGKTK